MGSPTEVDVEEYRSQSRSIKSASPVAVAGAGRPHETHWNGTTATGMAPAGIYFLRYESERVRSVHRLFIVC